MKSNFNSKKLFITVLLNVFVIIGALVGYINSGQAVTTAGLVSALYVAVQGIIDHKQAGQ